MDKIYLVTYFDTMERKENIIAAYESEELANLCCEVHDQDYDSWSSKFKVVELPFNQMSILMEKAKEGLRLFFTDYEDIFNGKKSAYKQTLPFEETINKKKSQIETLTFQEQGASSMLFAKNEEEAVQKTIEAFNLWKKANENHLP